MLKNGSLAERGLTIGAIVTRDHRLRGQSVTSKVLSVLEAFSTGAPRLSLKQLAESTALPQSTTYLLASDLVAWGGLERVEGGGYQIGLRLWEIGALATRENVHLAILDGTEALYIEKITGRGAAKVASRRGAGCRCSRRASGKSSSHTARETFSPR